MGGSRRRTTWAISTMRDDQTLECADADASSLFVRHATTIADAKVRMILALAVYFKKQICSTNTRYWSSPSWKRRSGGALRTNGKRRSATTRSTPGRWGPRLTWRASRPKRRQTAAREHTSMTFYFWIFLPRPLSCQHFLLIYTVKLTQPPCCCGPHPPPSVDVV